MTWAQFRDVLYFLVLVGLVTILILGLAGLMGIQ